MLNSPIFLLLMLSVTVCLDGTPPGYHLDRGFGSGANSWLIQLEVWLTDFNNAFNKFLVLYDSNEY